MEVVMSRWIAVLALISLVGVDRAQAQTQESVPGPGTFEITIIPGGATFFTEASDSNSPSFGNYDLGGSATVNFNRFVGVEGEVSGLLGVSQSLDFVNGTTTFLTGNVGGGVKWYAGRWGLRGDYRFIAVQSKDDAPAFFGQETRYGHRIYGGVILNVIR